ncbi:MAG: hypothetical protein M3326_01650 [Actinomycetota bacterium]|nr:hypothetical protein [Actinomycetota bacterium]
MIDCLLAARFSRNAFDGVQWETADAGRIVQDTATDLRINVKGQAKELQPIDLSKEPELAALVAQVDMADLAGPDG